MVQLHVKMAFSFFRNFAAWPVCNKIDSDSPRDLWDWETSRSLFFVAFLLQALLRGTGGFHSFEHPLFTNKFEKIINPHAPYVSFIQQNIAWSQTRLRGSIKIMMSEWAVEFFVILDFFGRLLKGSLFLLAAVSCISISQMVRSLEFALKGKTRACNSRAGRLIVT